MSTLLIQTMFTQQQMHPFCSQGLLPDLVLAGECVYTFNVESYLHVFLSHYLSEVVRKPG